MATLIKGAAVALLKCSPVKCTQGSLIWNPGHIYGATFQSLRFYPKSRYGRTKVRIPPKKPDFSYSGDLVTSLPAVDLTAPRVDVAGCPEFDNADGVTKKKLSLEYADHQEVMRYLVRQMSDKFGRYPGDTSSIEARIAILTVKIRNQIRHVVSLPKDKLHKAQLVEAIQKRAKWLKQLRSDDVQRFEWLCAELQLKWTPPPEYHRHIPKAKVERAATVSRALELKRKGIDELRKRLDRERGEFYSDGGGAAELERLEHELHAVAASRTELAALGHVTGYDRSGAAVASAAAASVRRADAAPAGSTAV